MSNLKILINKLSNEGRSALEQAANLCINKMHYEIEIEHFFIQLLAQHNNDLDVLAKKFHVDKTALVQDLEAEINLLSQGNQRTPVFSNNLAQLLEQSWLLASIEDESGNIRSGHLLIAALTSPTLAQIAHRASTEFDAFPVDSIKHKLAEYCQHSSEQPIYLNQNASVSDDASEPEPLASSRTQAKTPALDQFTINLTQKARQGEIDPVIGRETEIRQLMDILMRRRQNNPILTGEAGVGKTAVVEGLALKISEKSVPAALQAVEIHMLDMGLLQAGASVKGEFENRLKQVIQEVNASTHPIILFIDEAHTMIGAGGQAGQNDAANLLKPALARGQLRTIAATTWAEYKQFFEKDAALSRRFQVVQVEEPSVETAINMLRAMTPVMQQHFNIEIDDQALVTAVQASHRYITGRQLPDKAISVLDTASARVSLSQTAKPAALSVLEARQHNLVLEYELLIAEQKIKPEEHTARITTLKELLEQTRQDIDQLNLQWQQESQLVQEIKALQSKFDTAALDDAEDSLIDEIQQLRQQLKKLQKNNPLVHERVDEHVVSQIIADWTGIPLGKMQNDEIQAVLTLQDKLATRVMGQPHALHRISQGIRTASAKLEDPNKPQGVFMFVGPSGVGKTETALALADELYGGEHQLITINMSEYQEAHTVSLLKGAPPGYVGYGKGGVLTEAVRRNPYSVVLLDEVEKAHQDVQELFYQVFDKGSLEDGEGRLIDFKNTLIILTSNAGSSTVMQHCLNKPLEEWPDEQAMIEILQPSLHKHFKSAFLGRMRIVPYFPLHDDLLCDIIEHKLSKIEKRLAVQHGVQLSYDDSLVDLVLSRCTEVDSGARNIDNILNGSVLPDLATHLLTALADSKMPTEISITVDEKDQIQYKVIYSKAKRKTNTSGKAKDADPV